MRIGLFALAAGLLAGEAQAADQFDLVCRGTWKASIGEPARSVETRFRMDLAKGQWCEKSCEIVRSFVEITPTQLFLDRDEEPKRDRVFQVINRTNGDWYMSTRFFGSSSSLDGSCEPAPFSGINPRTKF